MKRLSRTLENLLHLASALALLTALALVFVVAPREATMGDVQRVFYFHVAAAWTGYLAILVAFVASAVYLVLPAKQTPFLDALSLSAIEIGLVFITQGILTGSIWAKATWGLWWIWEPRLTTSAVLWLIYASYLSLRTAIQEPGTRARLSAVYAVLGFVAVPINFMAIRWWRSFHPLVVSRDSMGLSPKMTAILVFSVLAFSLLFVSLLQLRLRLAQMQERIEELKRPETP